MFGLFGSTKKRKRSVKQRLKSARATVRRLSTKYRGRYSRKRATRSRRRRRY